MKKPNHSNKRFCPQSSNQELCEFTFVIGDLYLFHPTKKHCPSHSSLWGIYDRTEDCIIYLESSTPDLRHFSIWHRLPEEYRYSRRATRRELRDYMYNMGYGDSRLHHPHINKSSIVCPQRPRHSFPLDMRNA